MHRKTTHQSRLDYRPVDTPRPDWSDISGLMCQVLRHHLYRAGILAGEERPVVIPRSTLRLWTLAIAARRLQRGAGRLRTAMDTDDPDDAPRATVCLGTLPGFHGQMCEAEAAYEYVTDSGHPKTCAQARQLLIQIRARTHRTSARSRDSDEGMFPQRGHQ